ncbi:MAG: flavodoxin-dependent (E)-4-hydroxy-3 methylbut-2-enyl-diphosphate synthase [Candidatus Improbicoccus devescovinae]|nr:MAG: flavodoxin-dependent (E)-4-hydroxy-3 methylbut-2-enyl-diphosphate synthase [Candidatus Improbicoccus devescovinae]
MEILLKSDGFCMSYNRINNKKIYIRDKILGNNNKILVQSMLNVDVNNIKSNIIQAKQLQNAGSDIVRLAVPDFNAVKLISVLKENIDIPVVADIHFNPKLAVESVVAGADKIRINPGNIVQKKDIKLIANVCNGYKVPLRVGVNSGSLENGILNSGFVEEYDEFFEDFNEFEKNNIKALIFQVRKCVNWLEDFDFDNIVISVKSSCIKICTKAYEILAQIYKYPLHLGITSAGTEKYGIIKSSIGIGSLLLRGIGDTIRVSLSADPVIEVETGILILKSLGLYHDSVEIISCPTCGRSSINVVELAKKAEKLLGNIKKNVKIAIMGCPVNGPGEARDADLGVTGANGFGIIFKKGVIVKKIPEELILSTLLEEVKNL